MMNNNLRLSDLAETDLSELDVVERYARFAPVYDQSVEDWGYRSHRAAADILRRYAAIDRPVLDAGCGTGLVGKALADLGYGDISGMDISPDMLRRAEKRGHYCDLRVGDMTRTPYPFADNAFAAVTCIGVFSLIADPIPVFREFRRLVHPGGHLVFTQQEILYRKYGYEDILRGFERRNQLHREYISEPIAYLPNREGYEDRTLIYCVYRVIEDRNP
uniref:Ubiquinone/menaquinone biosynthesis C-methylase UbiE n=1 Tax=Candidatus Kentrum sp. TC TaxID=2126339 RepID=A0A450YU59_9GAMM|nr:MAG: Ubiquinone/menaquinone biosynthesis C-methylase UbiE [Candidatus Kentron sp. TC]VFK58254.1 MAG: Ubiquinone/menaquinone biosynthesis C-methylase UbiE [Candidatus Kentron sp. TC]